jgi:uncharacterized glyoxalase superfamily protein PhnB
MRLAAALLMLVPVLAAGQDQPKSDLWEAFRPMIGEWRGVGEGKSGESVVDLLIEFVMDERYISLRTTAVFEPQEKNPEGEVHEDIGFISFDEARGKYVFRQFHVEGFVNRYVLQDPVEAGGELAFVSEELENAPPSWQARVTYKLSSEDELQVSFDLSTGKDGFQCYSLNKLSRVEKDAIEFDGVTANLMVEDVNEAVEFYRDVLGFELVMSVPEEGRYDWAMISRGGAEIMLQSRASLAGEYPLFNESGIGGSLVLYFNVTGVDELYERVRGKAKPVIDIHDTPYGMREFAIEDNDGYVLTFAEELQQ